MTTIVNVRCRDNLWPRSKVRFGSRPAKLMVSKTSPLTTQSPAEPAWRLLQHNRP